MLHTRYIPVQDINDVRDRAEAETGHSEYARGILNTLLWLNGDQGSPFDVQAGPLDLDLPEDVEIESVPDDDEEE